MAAALVLPYLWRLRKAFSGGEAEALADGLDDADVGLVGDDEVDVGGGEAGAGDGVFAGFAGVFDGGFEDFLAHHVDESAQESTAG